MTIPLWNGPGFPQVNVELLSPAAFTAPGVNYLAPPIEAEPGDLLLAVWSHYNARSITPPAGWTLLGKRANLAPTLFGGALWVFGKPAAGDLASETWHLTATGASTANGLLVAFPAKPFLTTFAGYLDSPLVGDDGTTPDLPWTGRPTARLTFGGIGPSTPGDTANGTSSNPDDRMIGHRPPGTFNDGVAMVARSETVNPSPGATYTKSASGALWNSTFSVLVTVLRTGWHINTIPIG